MRARFIRLAVPPQFHQHQAVLALQAPAELSVPRCGALGKTVQKENRRMIGIAPVFDVEFHAAVAIDGMCSHELRSFGGRIGVRRRG